MEQNKIDFIISALNAYWFEASQKLDRKDLGDIERQQYEVQLKKSKELMEELDRPTPIKEEVQPVGQIQNCMFYPEEGTSSATKCKWCGKEKWEHEVSMVVTSTLSTNNSTSVVEVDEIQRQLSDDYFKERGYKFVDMMFENAPYRYWRKGKIIVVKAGAGYLIDLFNDKEEHIEVILNTIEEFESFTNFLTKPNK